MKTKYSPKNLKDCNNVDFCPDCVFGEEGMNPERCKIGRFF